MEQIIILLVCISPTRYRAEGKSYHGQRRVRWWYAASARYLQPRADMRSVIDQVWAAPETKSRKRAGQPPLEGVVIVKNQVPLKSD